MGEWARIVQWQDRHWRALDKPRWVRWLWRYSDEYGEHPGEWHCIVDGVRE